MAKELFRQEALKKLSSPDKLDEPVRIIKSRSWLVVSAIIALVVSVGVWSFLGHVTVAVKGEGILINKSGFAEVRTSFSGRVDSMQVSIGDTLERGQLIASVSQMDLSFEISRLEIEHRKIQQKYLNLLNNSSDEIREQKIKELNEKRHQLDLYLRGVNRRISESDYASEELLLEKEGYEKSVLSVGEELFELESFSNDRLIALQQRLIELKAEIFYKRNMYELKSRIVSPYDGIVTEVMLGNGDVFNNATNVISLEKSDYRKDELIALIYVNASEGKKVKPGMEVFVSPSTVVPEEHGYMKGEVLSVSKYPSTKDGMQTTLRNDELVNVLAGSGLMVAVEVKLNRGRSFSGYEWTTESGPEAAIVSGILADARIVIEKKAPITLVFPNIF